MKNFKEILKNKTILERRQDQTEILGDEGTGTIDVYGYGQDMPNMPTPPRGIVRTREYPGIVIHSVNTFTDGNRRGDNGRGYGRNQPTIGIEAEDFGPDDVDYNKERTSGTPAMPFILAGAGGYGVVKGSQAGARINRAARLAKGVIPKYVPSHQQIATRASGLNVGDDVANWLNAEKALGIEAEAKRLAAPMRRAKGTSTTFLELGKADNMGKLGGVARTADEAENLLRVVSPNLNKAAAAEKLFGT